MITDEDCRNLAPRSILWDYGKNKISAFGIRRQLGESVSFILMYRTKEGKQRKYTIGKFGNINAEQARIEALKLLEDVRQFKDPSLNKKATKVEVKRIAASNENDNIIVRIIDSPVGSGNSYLVESLEAKDLDNLYLKIFVALHRLLKQSRDLRTITFHFEKNGLKYAIIDLADVMTISILSQCELMEMQGIAQDSSALGLPKNPLLGLYNAISNNEDKLESPINNTPWMR